ncbi:hypothetical protein GPJ56_005521 [Histomonas meleagridis]|uniref:uncharacterized protein n=1 Tax=Histomonas meleagridis TaxID=135588 RepID=UPI00355A4A93|nr:hypothetical protein GPJ56_005521 [Histomonas meleagridis]KAH0799573.1 hypothetical protein GO595_007641 [Histomonas meleagridis]
METLNDKISILKNMQDETSGTPKISNYNNLNLQVKSDTTDREIKNLEWKVEASTQERSKLQAKVDSAKSRLSAIIKKNAQQIQQIQHEQREKEAILQAELSLHSSELEDLLEFQKQKDKIEDELSRLSHTLQQYRQAHQETMDQFRYQLQREKAQYENEYQRRIKKAEREAMDKKDKPLEDAAIRCIQDARAASTQLRNNQIKSREVLSANKDLVNKIESVRQNNQLITDREKMLIDDIAKYRQRTEAIRIKMSEAEVKYAKRRARIESESEAKIESLDKECAEIESENELLRRQIESLRKKLTQFEKQKQKSASKQLHLVKLLTSTAPLVLDSLNANGNVAEKENPVEILIDKLNGVIDDG